MRRLHSLLLLLPKKQSLRTDALLLPLPVVLPQKSCTNFYSGAYKNELFWKDTYVFWGDERFVPQDDDRYNAKMAYETLLNHVPVPRDQIYPMPYSDIMPPEEVARQYENLLRNHFNTAAPQFDLILLGMGDDGHTASYFHIHQYCRKTNAG
jgi:6-phosphogluconolactonase